MYTQNIIPHLWFDKEAIDAAEFYISAFPDARIVYKDQLSGTPSGDTNYVTFEIAGYQFMAISAGPYFKINPSISFMVNFDPSRDSNAQSNIDQLWERLSDGGKVLMPLDTYPFSKRYGWVEDKFGVSWQLILTDPDGEERPFIIPSLLFVNEQCGNAEEATNFYLEVFKDGKRGALAKYPSGMEPNKEGHVMFTDFMIRGQWFAAMDSALQHDFNFSEGLSLMIHCEDQAEMDYYMEKLSAVPEAEQCGWIKDKYGVSWQIVPREMHEMLAKGTREQIDRVTQTFLPMKRLDLAAIRAAYAGE